MISFQTYIEIFNKIEEVNLAVLVVSSITIVVLVINNEFLKVSTKRCHSFYLYVCVHVHTIRGMHAYVYVCVSSG
jgi:hypothetical protein